MTGFSKDMAHISFIQRAFAWLRRPRLSRIQLTLLVSALLALLYNNAFWSELGTIAAYSQQSWLFLASIFFLLLAFFHLCLSLLSFRCLIKPAFIFILFLAAFAAYFMETYGIMIDRAMIKNVLTTDLAHVKELLNVKMFFYLLVLGALPALLIVRAEIRYHSLLKELFMVVGASLTSAALFVLVVIFFYKEYISLGNNYNYLRHMVNPVGSIYAVFSCAKKAITSGKVVVRPVGEDARQERSERKRLVILVLGEAARAQNFSLNGYEKKTNPRLEKEDILNFTNAWSCGTASTVSLPCAFSHFGRNGYSDAKAERHEGLLDILQRAGIQALWRENNSGCRGVCDRVETQVPGARFREAGFKGTGEEAGLCADGECQDLVLLTELESYIDRSGSGGKDIFIVLHQKGSGGPAYYRRSPSSFKVFLPECTTNQLQECRAEELVNAYDNSILYTDHLLAQVIDLLKKKSAQFEGALVYLSLSGESLGEKNIYLHGLPYLIAPDEQKHVPFMVWLDAGFAAGNHIDPHCLRKRRDAPLSHDNLFHSTLGLLGVKTVMYNKELDIFAGCRQ